MELIFAADTAFNDFPRVLYFMARDDHAPRAFLRMGDRLAFSNGIVVLAVASALIFLAFQGQTQSLVPLYAVGVFLAFTLSQAGMVKHWWRARDAHWRKSLTVNALGAISSAAVLLTAAITKFTQGAWVVLVFIPLLVAFMLRVKAHYVTLEKATSVCAGAVTSGTDLVPPPVRPSPPDGTGGPGDGYGPVSRHLLVVPMARIDLPSLVALAFAASFRQPTLALHVSPEQVEADRFQRAWDCWGAYIPLEVVVSPYRGRGRPTCQLSRDHAGSKSRPRLDRSGPPNRGGPCLAASTARPFRSPTEARPDALRGDRRGRHTFPVGHAWAHP